jgi:predicted porin
MNKRFLAIAIAAGLAVSSTVMADGAEIYGIAHVSVNNYSYDATASIDAWTVTSNSSRLGFKGSEDLGGGLKAVYKIEYGVDLADTATVSNRNQYVGLSGGMGTVLLGRHDTPTKMVQGKFDVFNDTVADMVTSTGGGVDGDVRANNVIAYLSPKMGGMQLIAALIPGEGSVSGACSDGAGGSNCDGPADGTSISFTYSAGDLYVGFGMDSGDIVDDQMRLAATYKMDALQLGFLYNARSDAALAAADLANDEKAMGLSVSFGMGDNAVKAQFIQTTDINGASGADATAMTIGYDANLSARTTAYALYNMYSPDTTGASADVSVISAGITHSF